LRTLLLAGLWMLWVAAGPAAFPAQSDGGVSPLGANGDRYADLAVGVPLEDIQVVPDAGAVNVQLGSPYGLSSLGGQMWHQASPGVVDGPQTGELFGLALAGGDLNRDGYVDLAVGVPYEDVEGTEGAGAVSVLYGSAAGLSAEGNQLWHQDQPLVEGIAQRLDSFGWALAIGDLNGDGYADLAVGVPEESIGVAEGAGAVNVLYGSADGLSSAGNQLWYQDRPEVAGRGQQGDNFGHAVAIGDLNGDGYADLAVGVRSEDIEGVEGAGAVNVLYGSANGVSTQGNQLWHQDQPGVEGRPQTSDNFGWALAIGDLNGDGYADLAVGVPYESINGLLSAGAVNVLYGSSAGLSSTGDQLWHQDQPDVAGRAQQGDYFALTLAIGDLDGDGYGDLAVGVPLEDVEGAAHAGAVNVLYGSASGLSSAGNQYWHQEQPGVPSAVQSGELFGSALAAGDLNGDGYADLAVGVPREDIEGAEGAGAVNVLYGSADGLSSPAGNQLWHQEQRGVEGSAQAGDRFGYALAILEQRLKRTYLPLAMRQAP
jgi:disulfide bond formation protein DsbB